MITIKWIKQSLEAARNDFLPLFFSCESCLLFAWDHMKRKEGRTNQQKPNR
jgi:hypothetical protein